MNRDINKILVVRLSSMGDIVLTTAFVRLLKKRFPTSEIHFLLNKQFADIYRYNPNVNMIIQYDRNLSKKELKTQSENLGKYDVIFDLQNNRRSKEFTNDLSDNIFRIEKNYLHKLSLVYLKKPLIQGIKTIHSKYCDTASNYNIKDDDLGLEIWSEQELKNNKYDTNVTKNTIAVAPGAFHFTKRWLPERYEELVKKIITETDHDIILLGGKSDVELCEKIKKISDRITNYAGKTSILETSEVLNGCKAIVTNDTGVMHIASARQVPVVAIFGSTVKEFGFAPFRVKNIMIEKDVKCRPCTHIGRSSCPKKHFKCMADISVGEVYSALQRIIS